MSKVQDESVNRFLKLISKKVSNKGKKVKVKRSMVNGIPTITMKIVKKD